MGLESLTGSGQGLLLAPTPGLTRRHHSHFSHRQNLTHDSSGSTTSPEGSPRLT